MRPVISKEDAARRQLDAAIELFFCEGDLLAVYGLAAAVFVITENLHERKVPAPTPDQNTTFYSYLKTFLTGDEFSELKNELGKISGFLKHADRADNEMTDLNEIQTLAFLALTANNFKSIFGYLTFPMQQISGHALMAVEEDKLIAHGFNQQTIENMRKFRDKDPRFLKRAALEGIYKSNGTDLRKTTIGYLVLHP